MPTRREADRSFALFQDRAPDRAPVRAPVDAQRLSGQRTVKLDRRAGGLWITESGQITLAEARRLIVAHEDELTACLTVREKSELFRILMKVYLSAPSKSEPAPPRLFSTLSAAAWQNGETRWVDQDRPSRRPS
jgi:hypothetical protein